MREQAYNHDATGSITRKGDSYLHYGVDGRIAKAGPSADPANALAVSYTYNALGQRVFKSDARLSGSNNPAITQQTVYAEDGIGSTVLGQYGNRRSSNYSEPIRFDLRYPGQVWDEETQLAYNLNRYYDQASGRYIQADPIGLDGGWNRFGYVAGDPLNAIDPQGLNAVLIANRAAAWVQGAYYRYGPAITEFIAGASGVNGAVVSPMSPLVAQIPTSVSRMTPVARAVIEGVESGGLCSAQTASRAITLTNGFYQAEGSAFKFSDYYYNKLWSTGRGAPFLQAEEIFLTSKTVTPDRMAGFNRYVNEAFEMIYNPSTKEVWHLQPNRK